MCASPADKTAVLTGANAGIGRVTAIELAKRGVNLVLAGRSKERTQPVLDQIKSLPNAPRAQFVPLDLGDLGSVRACAAHIDSLGVPIDILINNAGQAGRRGLTRDGFESHFGINHLGPFLLTTLLLDRIKEAAHSRIVIVASQAHYGAKKINWDRLRRPTKTFLGIREYQVSKLCNVLFAMELTRRLEDTDVHTYSLHPGVIASDIWRQVPWPIRPIMTRFMITNEAGALTTLHCATSDETAHENGLYYDACRPKEASALAKDPALQGELWKRSTAWVG